MQCGGLRCHGRHDLLDSRELAYDRIVRRHSKALPCIDLPQPEPARPRPSREPDDGSQGMYDAGGDPIDMFDDANQGDGDGWDWEY